MKIASISIAASLLLHVSPSFSQSVPPLTRAQVTAQLVELERVGYSPDSDHTTYPASIQAAEAKVALRNSQSYGAAESGSSTSGKRTVRSKNAGTRVYFGH